MAKKKKNVFNYQYNSQKINNFMASVRAVQALHHRAKCEVCGGEVTRDDRLRCGTFDRYDFFGKPNYRIYYQKCPHCGYVSGELSPNVYSLTQNPMPEETRLKLKELVDSDSYKSCKGIVELSSNSFKGNLYQAFMCYQVKDDIEGCGHALLRLVWEMDETYMAIVNRIRNVGDMDSELSKIDFETLSDEERQDLLKSKETVFKWVLKDYFKCIGELIEDYYETFNRLSDNKFKEDYLYGHHMGISNSFVEMLINYIYYQRRFGDIDEAEKKLNTLKELKKFLELVDSLRDDGETYNKIGFFYEIEYANIQLIKYNKPIDPYLLTKAYSIYKTDRFRGYIL